MDCYGGDVGVPLRKLGREENIAQFRLAVPGPSGIRGHIGQALLWQESSRSWSKHMDVATDVDYASVGIGLSGCLCEHWKQELGE